MRPSICVTVKISNIRPCSDITPFPDSAQITANLPLLTPFISGRQGQSSTLCKWLDFSIFYANNGKYRLLLIGNIDLEGQY